MFKRKLLYCMATLSFTAYSLPVLAQVDGLIKTLHHSQDRHVLVAAHRGDWRNAPENSLRGYQLAINMGVDIIEVDLNKTSDGVLVIMHDGTINRTTDGNGKPSDYTLEQLKKFHLRNGLGILTKNTIPTFEEVMLLAKGKVLVNLDKSLPYYEEAYAILKKTGTLQQAIFKSEATYQELQEKYPRLLDSITYMPVVNLAHPNAKQIIDDYQQHMKPVAFELIFQRDTSHLLQENRFIVQHGSRIWINSLWPSLNGDHADDKAVEEGNIKDSWDWLMLHGANILQTDRPKELLAYLRKRALHS